QVTIAETCMFDRARQIKAEIISGSSHGRNFVVGVKARVGRRQYSGEQFLLLLARDYIEPDGKDICVLAEVLLRRSVGKERVLFVLANFFHAGDRAVVG